MIVCYSSVPHRSVHFCRWQSFPLKRLQLSNKGPNKRHVHLHLFQLLLLLQPLQLCWIQKPKQVQLLLGIMMMLPFIFCMCCMLTCKSPLGLLFLEPACDVGGAVQVSRRRTNDQQLQEIKEVVEEAELAQTMIHSLTQSSGCPTVTSTRSITGSSSITSNPLHRAKNSHLHDR